ncbi:MAG: hypothetical protein HWN67_10755 [Candidatus Helarchaeota archaeon]|nr:hypothetical protein [Candidatus Helarchaeota archaeon]
MTINNEGSSGIGYLIGFIFIITTIINVAITAVITVIGRTPEYRYIGIFNISCLLIELVLVYFGSKLDSKKMIYTGVVIGIIAQIIIIPSLFIKLDYIISEIKLTILTVTYIILSMDIEFDLNFEMNLQAIVGFLIMFVETFQRRSSNRVGGVGTNIVVAIIGLIINIIGYYKPNILKHIQYIIERNPPSRRSRNYRIDSGIDTSYRDWRSEPVPKPPSIPTDRLSHPTHTSTIPKPSIDLLSSHNEKIYERVHLGKEFTLPSKPLICSSCGNANPENAKICKSCLNNIPKCLICNRAISAEQIVYCPFCNAYYHKTEFFEWLKVKAICKNCNKELDLWEFQKYSKQPEHLDEIASINCPNCKKTIPRDANFCIFCGIKIE